ncbi:hypothetical protein B0T17DRAFT_615290 [Bombardia bombarda]|uniref:Uncharacterized protein n=1 Tax=Bombardia bombarda TaxID=252184 RepID=A0AA40C8K1_9PEZI|nr:hypothetical protein B0T17DRAFT_615290 [Bombardia bombarda]
MQNFSLFTLWALIPCMLHLVGVTAIIHDMSANPAFAARDALANPPKGALNCGIFSTASKRDVMDITFQLRESKDKCVTPANKCFRHKCKNTSGIYVCNDNDHDVTLDCSLVGAWSGDAGGCCPKDWTKSKGVSGQLLSTDGWNVIVAYANCNHPADQDRPAMGPDNSWGPNGPCES